MVKLGIKPENYPLEKIPKYTDSKIIQITKIDKSMHEMIDKIIATGLNYL